MRLFLDACALIYRFEGADEIRRAATEHIADLVANQPEVELTVSRLSVLECRVKPLREGNHDLLQRYSDFFAAVNIVELRPAVVELATSLRVQYGLKTPDALQAACAIYLPGETVFVTGDVNFAKVTELDVRLIEVHQF